jgi:serine-type D-Ala-D-Ala carboxypeptidase/endopeptidase (penicillin-binding protein 4)
VRALAIGLALWIVVLGRAVAAQPVPVTSPSVAWSAADVAALEAQIDRELSAPAIRGAHLGFYAIDTNRGTVLYARAPDEAFVPASTLKLITGSVALERLGRDFRFHTSVLANVTQPDTIEGDIVLRGGGDPLLRASDLDAAAAQIAMHGITTIHGGVAIDDAAFDQVPYAPGWMMEDVPYDFSAIVSGVMLEEGTVTLHVAATSIGAPATIGVTPLTNAVTLENATTTGNAGSAETLDVQRDGAAVRVVGSIPAGKQSTLVAAVPDPIAYAGDVFARALAAHGVTFDPPFVAAHAVTSEPAGATVLWTHDSEPLAQLLQWFWFRSDNLVGEALLKTLGVGARGTPGTSANGIALETSYLRNVGIDAASVAIVDGSGLSRYDACTPRADVALLQSDWKSADREAFLDALPVAGVRGSLRATFVGTPAEGRVYAKSGSMTHVWNLAGYVMTRRHGPVTFALLSDDFVGDPATLLRIESAIFSELAGA